MSVRLSPSVRATIADTDVVGVGVEGGGGVVARGWAYRDRLRVTSPECRLISRSSDQRNKYITPGAGGLRLPKNGI